MAHDQVKETLTHRLILPRDANHYGTLYAGVLLSLSLEAAYAAAYRALGPKANLVLKRVLDLRCYQPVPVGSVIEIQSLEVQRKHAQIVVGLRGAPLNLGTSFWMDGLMQFVQIGQDGQPQPIQHGGSTNQALPEHWSELNDRATRLLSIRVRGRGRNP